MNGYNFTDRVRKVLQVAREEAARLGQPYAGTEHILLGMWRTRGLREEKGMAADVLTDLGVMLDQARAETLRLLATEMPSGPHGQRRVEILARMRALVAELLGDANRLRQLATELSGLLDELGRPE